MAHAEKTPEGHGVQEVEMPFLNGKNHINAESFIACNFEYCVLKYRTPDVKCNDTIHTSVPDVSNLDLQESGPGALDPR